MSDDLPLVDTQEIAIDAPPERVWDAVVVTVSGSFGGIAAGAFARAIGCEPSASAGEPGSPGSTVVGFRVAEALPPRSMRLEGRHRFSRYRLELEVAAEDEGAVLAATTRAEFPGPHGTVYRALVVGSRAHALVKRRILGIVKRRAEQRGGPRPAEGRDA